jgi:hypothetical protein
VASIFFRSIIQLLVETGAANSVLRRRFLYVTLIGIGLPERACSRAN